MADLKKFLAGQKQAKVPRDSRHIAHHSERLADGVRVHVVVVDDKNREEIHNRVLGYLRQCGGVEQVRSCEGRVKDSKMHYLFRSYVTDADPNLIQWTQLGRPVVEDTELFERRSSDGIEVYVDKKYAE
jgi:hypothetical protein